MKPRDLSEPKDPISLDEVDRLYAAAEELRLEVERAKGRDIQAEWLAAHDAWRRAIEEVVDAARRAGHPRPNSFLYAHIRAIDETGND
jgi:hypothetical protein